MRYFIAIVLVASGTVDVMAGSAESEKFPKCLSETDYAIELFNEYLKNVVKTQRLIPEGLEQVYHQTEDYIQSVCPAGWVVPRLSKARADFLRNNDVPNQMIEDSRESSTNSWIKNFPTKVGLYIIIRDAIGREARKRLDSSKSGVQRPRQMSNEGYNQVERGVIANHEADLTSQERDAIDRAELELETARSEARAREQHEIEMARQMSAHDYGLMISEAMTGRSHHVVAMPIYPAIQTLPGIPAPVPLWEKGVKISPKELSVEVQKLRNDQEVWDREHTESIPYLLYDGENLGGGLGRITLGNCFVQKEDVLLFHISEHPEWVIKYQSNCYTLDEYLLDLERDFWFQHLIAGQGIGPIVHFMSPPVKLPEFITEKTEFNLKWKVYLECAKNKRSYLRYMVMDRIPASLHDLMVRDNLDTGIPDDPPKKFKMSLDMAKSVIAKLKLIHEFQVDLGGLSATGIIHGDVHPGNIVQLYKDNDVDFGLLDFGKALFSSEIRPHTDMGSWDPHCFLSHYNMKGAGFSYRDDVYKTLLAAAFLMTGTVVYRYCKDLAKQGRDEIIDFHTKWFLFDISGSGNVFRRAMPGGTDEQRTGIANHLIESLRLVRGVQNVNDKPPYDAIIRELDSALQIFKTR